MSDRPLSERVRDAERGSDWWDDPLSDGFDEFDSDYLADEIAALEAERGRLREAIGRAMSFLRTGGYADDAYGILRAALEEGGEDD